MFQTETPTTLQFPNETQSPEMCPKQMQPVDRWIGALYGMHFFPLACFLQRFAFALNFLNHSNVHCGLWKVGKRDTRAGESK